MARRTNLRRNGRAKGGKLGKGAGGSGTTESLRAPAPLLWCELDGFVPGHTVRVFLSSPESCPKLRGLEGVIFDAKNGGVEIHIDRSCPEDVQRVTLMHELMHAAVWTGGDVTAAEEKQIERIAPGLLEGLLHLGFCFPSKPNEEEI